MSNIFKDVKTTAYWERLNNSQKDYVEYVIYALACNKEVYDEADFYHARCSWHC